MSTITAIAVIPGATYDVSAWLKTANVNAGNSQLVVTFWSSSQSYVGVAVGSAFVSGTQDFTRVGLSAPAPAGAAFARVEFRLTGPGTLWADDVSVTRH